MDSTLLYQTLDFDIVISDAIQPVFPYISWDSSIVAFSDTIPLSIATIKMNTGLLGQISGPMLSNNLLRNGIDIAFDTQLLYFDVTSRTIGINTDTPASSAILSVVGETASNNAITSNIEINDFVVVENKIQHVTSHITIAPSRPPARAASTWEPAYYTIDGDIEFPVDTITDLYMDWNGSIIVSTEVVNISPLLLDRPIVAMPAIGTYELLITGNNISCVTIASEPAHTSIDGNISFAVDPTLVTPYMTWDSELIVSDGVVMVAPVVGNIGLSDIGISAANVLFRTNTFANKRIEPAESLNSKIGLFGVIKLQNSAVVSPTLNIIDNIKFNNNVIAAMSNIDHLPTTPIGTTRYNPTANRIEVSDGIQWVYNNVPESTSVSNADGTITITDDIMPITDIMPIAIAFS